MSNEFESWARLPTLAGKRVRLRWLTADDVPALYEIFSDTAVMRYWSSAPLESTSDARSLLEDIHRFFADRTLLQWGVEQLDEKVVIGTCTLLRIDFEHHRCEVGYALRHDAWGNGYAGEALSALLNWAFDTLDMNRIEADIDPRNEPSIRLVERLGFKREGLLRERYHLNGEIQDSLIFGLLRREFAEHS